MKNLYLYEIQLKNKTISGILLTIDPREHIVKKVIAHEQTNVNTLNEFFIEFSAHNTQKSPIIFGIPHLTFMSDNNFKLNTEKINITENETAWLIKDTSTTEIINTISTQSKLFLIDGHHRFQVLQKLLKPITVWIVDLHALSIKSFIKIYHDKQKRNIISKLQKRFNLCKKYDLKLNGDTKQINIFFNGQIYQLITNKTKSFVEQICEFNEFVEDNNLIFDKSIEYSSNDLSHFMQKYKNDYFIVTHTALNKNEFLHTKLLPINSTCFNPKPNENSLTLLNNIQKVT